MQARGLRARRAADGMTLLEVLAAVFCLGMGLIMVAGAFPAGAHQTRLTIEQTEATQMAKSAMEQYITQVRAHRNLTTVEYSASVPMTKPLELEKWCVWNPHRLPYMENWDESKMWPPGGGDFVMRGFLTRVSAQYEAPLFRLTVVVARYDAQKPDFYDPSNPAPSTYPAGVRSFLMRMATGDRLIVGTINKIVDANRDGKPDTVAGDSFLNPGDYVMDTSTGLCFRIRSINSNQVYLTEDVVGTPARNKDWFMFRNVIGVYYRLIS